MPQNNYAYNTHSHKFTLKFINLIHLSHNSADTLTLLCVNNLFLFPLVVMIIIKIK